MVEKHNYPKKSENLWTVKLEFRRQKNVNEIIEKLNELEVADVDFDSDEIVYVLVEDNEDNRKRLIELGATEAEITSMIVDGGALDITIFAFEKCGADWYKQDEGFGKN